MDYRSIIQQDKDLVLTEIKNFNLPQILDNGQSFRWSGDENSYSGIAHGRLLELCLNDGNLILKNVSVEEFENIWKDYFDLGRSYDALRLQYLSDITLEKAIAHSPGLRLMKQDPWEALITFILSQNNNIPRIKGMVSRLCKGFGTRLPTGGYTFPEAMALAEADLSDVRCGYRDLYIKDAARRVFDGRLNLEKLKTVSDEELRVALLEVHGVGAKVADCVMLFGFGRIKRFPVDVWMQRVIMEYYPDGFPENLLDTAGIAQQFLFHYIRTIN